jgi:D-glycerate 3-kinase
MNMRRTHLCSIVESQVSRPKDVKDTVLLTSIVGTHDMVLARELFLALKTGAETTIPQYDKSAFNGQGDRVPPSQWASVNGPGQPKAQVIIFEGWCVGFRALSSAEVEAKKSQPGTITLYKHRLEDLLFVNEKLKAYDVMTDCFDAFIHIDAEETGFVYDWRQQQEAALRRDKGTGMSEEEVNKFVDGYYPAYELFTAALRDGIFKNKENLTKGRQLRLIVGKDRRVRQVIEI